MSDLIDVPDELVETVARQLWQDACSEYDYDWDLNAEQFRAQARGILTSVVPVLRAQIEAETREKVDNWLRAYAYSSEDIVLGDTGLTASQITDLHALLDSLSPDWRARLARGETNV